MRVSLNPLLLSLVVVAACGRTPLDPMKDGSVDPDGGPPPVCASDSECGDGLFCNGVERCADGRCVGGGPVSCDDGVACTVDRCDETARGCQSVPDSGRCGMGEICDPVAGCVSRRCASDRECQDRFVCNGAERCAGGLCAGGTPPRCDDGIACTADECSEAAGGCVPRPDHARCDDGRFCNGAERCEPAAGGCISRPFDCEDGDPCTADRCNEARRTCEHEPVGGPGCAPWCPDEDLGRSVGPGVATGTTTGAGDDMGGSCGGSGAPERTFRWTAPWDGTYRIHTLGSSYDTLLYVRRRCAGSELPGACNDDAEGSLQSSVTVSLAGLESVIIVVDGFGSNHGAFRLSIHPDGGGCEMFETVCDNGRDDDCDGIFDCMDPDCFGRPECGPPPCTDREFACADFLDEDCDGLIDCADPDCAGDPACCVPGPERCSNGRDDDCDRLVDCRDPDCRFSLACRRPDGGLDAGVDAGLDGGGPPPDGGMCTDREIGVAACTDGRDGDCDGRADCRDTDCSPFGPGWECCNGLDDDGDGQVDIFTCRCRTDADCATVGTLEQVCWTELYSVCAPRCNFYGGDAFCRMFADSLRCDPASGQCL